MINEYSRKYNISSLASLLANTTSYFVDLDQIPREGTDWSAQNFLADVFRASMSVESSLTRASVKKIFDEGGLPVKIQDFESRGILRNVFGRVRIPSGVRSHVRSFPSSGAKTTDSGSNGQSQVPPDTEHDPSPEFGSIDDTLTMVETKALENLIAKDSGERPILWIEETVFASIHRRYQEAHKATPNLDSLLRLGLFEPFLNGDSQGYRLTTRNGVSDSNWNVLLSQSAALVWEGLLREDDDLSDEQKLFRYFDLIQNDRNILAGLKHLPPASLQRLRDASVCVLLKEADIQDPTMERAKMYWEVINAPRFAAFGERTPAFDGSLSKWFKRWNKLRYYQSPFSCRDELDTLVYIVLATDDGSSTQTVKLLEESSTRPYLVVTVCQMLGGPHRKQIPGIIANQSTCSLGMNLLAGVSIEVPVGAQMETFESKERAIEETKTSLWRHATDVFLETLGEARPVVAKESLEALVDVLVLAAEPTVRFDLRPLSSLYRQGSEKRFQILTSGLSTQLGLDLPKWLSDLRCTFAEHGSSNSSRNSSFECMPLVEMKLLFWLLEVAGKLNNESQSEMVATASAIVDLYCAELNRDLAKSGNFVSWIGDASEALSLPWIEVALVLDRSGSVEKLIGPSSVMFKSKIENVPSTVKLLPNESHTNTEFSVYRTLIRKLRLHLRVLIQLHDECLKSHAAPRLKPSHEEILSLRLKIESQLGSLLNLGTVETVGAGRPSVFDLETEGLGTGGENERFSLVSDVVIVLNLFTQGQRDLAFTNLVESTTDPTVLLKVAGESSSFKARKLAEERLSALNMDSFLKEQFWLPKIKEIVLVATSQARSEIAEEVLDFVQKHYREIAARSDWVVFEYEMRLAIAYHRRDLEGLNALQPPNSHSAHAPQIPGQQNGTIESAMFFKGLLLLEKEPERSVEIFETLIRRRPGNLPDVINRFAAVVCVAKKVLDPIDRKKAFHRVLRDWEALRPTLSTLELRDVHILYNELCTFDGAGMELEFDERWRQLLIEQRTNIEFVRIGIECQMRRGQRDEALKILNFALPYHTDSSGRVDESFKNLEVEIAAGGTITTSTFPVVDQRVAPSERLKSSHQALLEASPETVAQVLGMGQDTDLQSFLRTSLVSTAVAFVDRIDIWRPLKIEDNYNDVLVTLLRMRLSFLHWQVGPQDPGSLSPTGIRAGERDFTLRTATGDLIAIVEAMRLKYLDKAQMESHITKAVDNYNKPRVPHIFIVVYFEGDQDWDSFHQGYTNSVNSMSLRPELKIRKPGVSVPTPSASAIRFIDMLYERYGDEVHVSHILINIGPDVT